LIQDVNEKERNIDAQILEAASNLDQRYAELQSKIDSDIKSVTKKELELEEKAKVLKELEDILTGQLDEINEKREKFEQTLEDYTIWEAELHKLNGEIQDWENLHWKFQRNCTPPSAIV
jgi:chromosome segregation ATPase